MALIPIHHLPVKLLIDYAKQSLLNIPLKPSAMQLLKTLYQHMGKDLQKMISDLPAATLKALNSEFESLEAPAKPPNFQFSGEYLAEIQANPVSENPLDSIPRVDISGEVSKVLKKLNDPDWKVRREGIDALEQILVTSKYR